MSNCIYEKLAFCVNQLIVFINNIMEFEDSRNALFTEPNAYIQRFEKREKETKKIVFQEPYECLPSFHINNNFTKHNCDCVSKKNQQNEKQDCKCNHDSNKRTGFNFDLKNLMPLLGLFNNGGGTDLSSLVGLLNNANNGKNEISSNPISNLLSNKDMMSGILNLFKGGGLNLQNKKQPTKKEIKTTDFEIKNYTRVE